MISQLLSEYQSKLSEKDFEVLKDFIECVYSGNIYRKGHKMIICLKGEGGPILLEKIWSLVDDKDRWEPGDTKLDTYKHKLVIFREYSNKYVKLMMKATSGDMVYGKQQQPCSPESNVIYAIADDNVKNMSTDVIRNRSIYINV
jgi:hypothetical protein